MPKTAPGTPAKPAGQPVSAAPPIAPAVALPAKPGANVGQPGVPDGKAALHIAGLTDRSLEAYKTWVRDFVLALNPAAANDLTEDEWEADWHAFWAATGAPEAADAQPAPAQPASKGAAK